MFQINIFNRKPIYEQLIDQTERLILTGILTEEEQLPSVRSLSVELSVNPNTIQKAYAELDRRGLTYVIPGRGKFCIRAGEGEDSSDEIEPDGSICDERKRAGYGRNPQGRNDTVRGGGVSEGGRERMIKVKSGQQAF